MTITVAPTSVNNTSACAPGAAAKRATSFDIASLRFNAHIYMRAGDFYRSYIEALRAADKKDIQPLLVFARS